MQAHERREIGRAIRAYDAGRDDEGRALLCRLAGNEAPDKPATNRLPILGTIGERTAPTVTERAPAVVAQRTALVTMLPKPRLRVVNPRAITAYKKKVRGCETAGGDCWGPLDFSHLRSKNDEGDDCEENGLIQCRLHHSMWELTRVGWWRAVGEPRLAPEARAKVLRIYPGLPDGDDRLADAA